MVGLVETPGPPSPGLGFSVSHQKVELDIDVLKRSLKGKTEITINPHFKELKTIRLNCRQCVFTRLNINGKGPTSKNDDPYKRSKLNSRAGVHQHHLLRQKLEPQFRQPPEEELVMNLPKSVRIEELDPFSAEAQNLLHSRVDGAGKTDLGDSNTIDLNQSSKTAVEQTARFTSFTIYAEWSIENIRDGMHFVGWEDADSRYPHAYSSNSLFPGAACCLFPCVDDISSRCTWEISIKCHRTLGDALKGKRGGPEDSQANGVSKHDPLVKVNGVDESAQDQMMMDGDDDSVLNVESNALDISVVCSGDMTDEIVDPSDPAKKTTSFICTTPVAPQHIGFAIGPFEHVNLSEFRESDEDDKLGQNAVPVHGFCLPGRVDELRNTCVPMAKAIDYYTVTYGSYPFSSYKLCFVDDLVSETVATASLSICSTRLLCPEGIIDPLITITRTLVHTLASQWIGVNIIPKEPTDMWAVVGIAYFITDMFMKKLCGNNEYRYRQKKAADRVCELDLARPSLFDTGALLSLDPSELDFMILKAPLVLFTLDRRLAKASGSSGLSRIISRVFLNAKVGDLANGAITTAYFLRTCEKLGHAKLDTFFSQWVFGAGCPRFYVTQRFNKKKLVVEMLIRQVQSEQNATRDLDTSTFMRDVKEETHNVYAGEVQSAFTGPMTIRIHEADGTPYEHIVEIKEAVTKFDIPYNTKYKRLKRSRRQKERAAAVTGADFAAEAQDDVLLYCLGDVLQSEEEVADWRLVDWSKDDEDRMSQESYEWIRMDADFEWICKLSMNMPGYMYLSQLQQDRDVVAQLESVQYMAAQKEHALVSTILVRTLMDRRYFHGIRTTAAGALSKHAKDELNWIGLHHLEKAFQEFFCFPDSPMTRSNDFSDRTTYYIQCAIPQAIAKVRDNVGKAPLRVKKFLFDKLKFNDNSNNEFSDCHYVATLMSALAESLISNDESSGYNFNAEDEDEEDETRFHSVCVGEIERYRRMDEWIPSYQNLYSVTALKCKRRLAQAKVIPIRVTDFLQYTRQGTFDPLRLAAFTNMVELGLLKNDVVLEWFLSVLGSDPSPYVRQRMQRLFGKGLAIIAIGEGTSKDVPPQQNGLIIEQESSTESRQADLARKQSVSGALTALKQEIGSNAVLKRSLWEAVTSPEISLFEIRDLLDICGLLYEPITSMIVALKYPRYWKVENLGHGKLKFSWTDKIRTKPIPKLQWPPAPCAPPSKREDSSGSIAPARTLLKPPKKPPAAPPAATAISPPPTDGKPKLTIKLKMSGGGARSPPAQPS